MSTGSRTPSPSLDRRPLERSNAFREFTANFTSTTSRVATGLSQTTRDAINAEVPLGAWAAAAGASSKAPTFDEIRRGSLAESGRTEAAERATRKDSVRKFPAINDATEDDGKDAHYVRRSGDQYRRSHGITQIGVPHSGEEGRSVMASQDTGPPVRVSRLRATVLGLRAFWRWFITPFGFLVTIYAQNVVAWGGMLFLLLCNAAPEMCWALTENEGWIHNCDHLYSSRRIWVEIDSQILNALFCVTGFGLIPWRFRDLYYLLRWRLLSEKKHGRHQKLFGLRTLAGLYRKWVRLPGSDTLDRFSLEEYNAMAFQAANDELSRFERDLPSVKADALDPRVPWKVIKTPPPPTTGIRAPPTALWKIDFFVWANVWNTFFQACLCGFMWGMSRFDRPSWSTGLFIALACIVSGVAGIMSFLEGKKTKKIEGV